jgi:DNA-binding NarL/FixJ family response regulator
VKGSTTPAPIPPTGRIQLLVAEIRDLHRAALSAAFDTEDDVTVVAQVSTWSAAVAHARRLAPNVVCLGVGRPMYDCLAVCEQVKAQRPAQRVVMIDDSPDTHALAAAVQAGADGYVTKDLPLAVLVDAVRRVHAGEVVIPPAMLRGLLHTLVEMRRRADKAYTAYLRLTNREKQVLELLGEGCGNTVIAQTLMISPQTARTHIQNVVRKLGTHSRLEAAAIAAEYGWVRNEYGPEP